MLFILFQICKKNKNINIILINQPQQLDYPTQIITIKVEWVG